MTELPFDEEVEVSPGLIVQRRSVLAGLGGIFLAGVPVTNAIGQATGVDPYRTFLDSANTMAQQSVADTSVGGQDRYLRSLAALASDLREVPDPASWNNTNQGDTPESYRIGFTPGGDPFTVLQWRLEPGARCIPHAHTYGNVVSVGLEGMVRVSNFEVDGEPDFETSDSFHVRQTVDQLLGPGSINLVSLHRNYIHGFVAGPNGARGLDITTRLKPRPEHSTPYLDVAMADTASVGESFESAWIYRD
jgi:hypothetical protein